MENEAYNIYCDKLDNIKHEVQTINSFVNDLTTSGLLEQGPYNNNKKMFKFYDNANVELGDSSSVPFFTSFSYSKTQEYNFFIKHNFKTKDEYTFDHSRRLTQIKEWLPILVSIFALLLSSIPSWVNLFNNDGTKLVVEQIPTVNVKLINDYENVLLNERLRQIDSELSRNYGILIEIQTKLQENKAK